MDLTVGSIYEGKVTGITKFGAFVSLPGGKSGMVHISEIANTYVDDIHNFLQEGQTVTVKLIGIDEQNRVNLSIKKALPPPPPRPAPVRPAPFRAPAGQSRTEQSDLPRGDDVFESKLKAFMQSSESKMSDLRSQNDKRSGGRRKR
ncbi:MAG: S1 RNA-binding domain-containing protein [Clostridiaceae bacterium]|nr:S1 RNA-binding domain-containing protein [Clostridiaceae bacterium]